MVIEFASTGNAQPCNQPDLRGKPRSPVISTLEAMRLHLIPLVLLVAATFPVLADEREICRMSHDENQMVECLERGVYDPCDDASPGSRGWITAQCAWAHAEVANRKIHNAEKEIEARLKKVDATATLIEFQESQRKWRAFVDYYCRFTNHAAEAGVFAYDPMLLSYGFCLRRHHEQRASELGDYLAEQK